MDLTNIHCGRVRCLKDTSCIRLCLAPQGIKILYDRNFKYFQKSKKTFKVFIRNLLEQGGVLKNN